MPKYTEWSDELVKELAEPFPRELHQQKDRRGTFVSVHDYVHRLNALVGPQGWSMEPPTDYHSGNKLGLCVGVTIFGVTKWNVGDEMEDHGEPDEDNKVRDFGSSSTNSWAQGFKRCMAYGFGLGLYLYDKQWTKQYLAGGPRPEPPANRAPRVSSPLPNAAAKGEATEQQRAAIGRLLGEREVELDECSRAVDEAAASDLTFARASEIIRTLDQLPKVKAHV